MVIAKTRQITVLIGIAAPAWGQNIPQPDVPVRIRVLADLRGRLLLQVAVKN